MTISKETEAEILRLYHAEKWKQNTIAEQLGLHSSTVYRVLRRNGLKKPVQIRSSMSDEYVPFIRRTLTNYSSRPKFPKRKEESGDIEF